MTLKERQEEALQTWKNSDFKKGKEQDEYNLLTAILIDSYKDELKQTTADSTDNEKYLIS